MVYGHLAFFAGGNEDALVQRIAGYFSEALERDGVGIMVTNRPRRDAVVMRVPALAAIEFIDSEKTLRAIYRDGRIDAHAFDQHVGNVVRRVLRQNGARKVYAYGDMVDILSARDERGVAIELERYWNDLRAQMPFQLFCGYHSIHPDERNVDGAAEIARLHTDVTE